jgi:UDP-N-acetylmuramate dehydrogenase
MFKNPPEAPAWKLIDQVGLRGRRIGDAQISEKHCNFFINVGRAKAADVKALIDLARRLVYERFGVELQTEVALVGEGFE